MEAILGVWLIILAFAVIIVTYALWTDRKTKKVH